MKRFAAMMAIAALAGCAGTGDVKNVVGPDKVIYHLNEGNEQASDGLRNIRNHLEANPRARIVVVTHSRGIDFLMKDARDKNGNPYNIPVEEFKQRGVRFEVCEIAMRSRKLTRSQFIEEASFVPSGVGEIARLQQREGYAYLKP